MYVAYACKTNRVTFKRNECETSIQDKNKYGCTESLKFCRTCCYFDLIEMNKAKHNDLYFLKEIISHSPTQYCICKYCHKNL